MNKNTLPQMITSDGKRMEISPRGSLALLAFGARGIDLWRQVRMDYNEGKNPEKDRTTQHG